MDLTLDSPPTTLGERLTAPVRRRLLRLLRPTLERLRDVLRTLTARQDADRARIERLENQVAALQARLDAARPLLTDYLTLTRRLGLVEDRMLRELAGTNRRVPASRAA
jgi:hypothetical protein